MKKENENLKNTVNINKTEYLTSVEKLEKNLLELKQNFDELSIKNLVEKKNSEKNIIKINEPKKVESKPENFEFVSTISSQLFNKNIYGNRFCLFVASDNKIYVVYGIFGVLSYDLECYDILQNKKNIIINKLHDDTFDSCRYYFYEKCPIDLIITTSHDKHIKLIDFFRKSVILDINSWININEKIYINTAYFIDSTIIVPFTNGDIRYYNFLGGIIKEIKNEAGFVLALSTWFDSVENDHYILISNCEGIIVFEYENLNEYHNFLPDEKVSFSEAHVIEKKEDNTAILIGPSFGSGCLFIWDIFTFECIDVINVGASIL